MWFAPFKVACRDHKLTILTAGKEIHASFSIGWWVHIVTGETKNNALHFAIEGHHTRVGRNIALVMCFVT